MNPFKQLDYFPDKFRKLVAVFRILWGYGLRDGFEVFKSGKSKNLLCMHNKKTC